MCINKAQDILPFDVQFHFNPLHAKKMYLHMFDIVDTTFSYKIEWIVCSFVPDFSKEKGKSTEVLAINLQCTYCVFTLWTQIYPANFNKEKYKI